MADQTALVVVADNTGAVVKSLDAATARALEKIGLVAEGYAKRLCPVDTGRLRNSVTHATDGYSVYIGTNVEYAPCVEEGTKFMPAKAFLRPAAADHLGEYRDIVRDELLG